MNPEIEQLKRQIEELTQRINNLNSSVTIPLEIGNAFKTRLGSLKDISNKAPSSETASINTAVPGITPVAMPMDGFFITADGKYIPFYN